MVPFISIFESIGVEGDERSYFSEIVVKSLSTNFIVEHLLFDREDGAFQVQVGSHYF